MRRPRRSKEMEPVVPLGLRCGGRRKRRYLLDQNSSTELNIEAAAAASGANMSVARGSLESWVSVMTTADPVLVADDVVVVDASSSTSQPRIMVLVEKTRVAVVVVTVPDVEIPYDVVVAWIVADCVSHDVGSGE